MTNESDEGQRPTARLGAKKKGLVIVNTGRYAPPELIAYSDLVTEMREVKHPFKDQGIRAQRGVEF